MGVARGELDIDATMWRRTPGGERHTRIVSDAMRVDWSRWVVTDGTWRMDGVMHMLTVRVLAVGDIKNGNRNVKQ